MFFNQDDICMANLLIASVIFFLSFQSASTGGENCFIQKKNYIIRPEYVRAQSIRKGPKDCLNKCSCNPRCISSFDWETGICTTTFLSATLQWTKQHVMTEKNLTLYFHARSAESQTNKMPKPVGVWPMDNIFKGKNIIGSKSTCLDMSQSDLAWNKEGPLGSKSPLKYIHFGGNGRLSMQNRFGGWYQLDFERRYSIGMWVKTDDKVTEMPLLEGWNADDNYVATNLWFATSKIQDQLSNHGRVISMTKPDHTDRLKWRHITLVYDGVKKYDFYLNANIMSKESDKQYLYRRNNPDIINFGFSKNKEKYFFGSMSCISFFDVALSQKQIYLLMKSCP